MKLKMLLLCGLWVGLPLQAQQAGENPPGINFEWDIIEYEPEPPPVIFKPKPVKSEPPPVIFKPKPVKSEPQPVISPQTSIDPNSRYTKISSTGQYLPKEATDWACVYDKETKRVWEVKYSQTTYKWDDIGQRAVEVNQVSLCGHRDWRVPNIDELRSLVKKGAKDRSIDTEYFPNTDASYFWSSSPYADSTSYVWIVYFHGGYDSFGYKPNSEFVRLVRGGQ